MSIKAKDALFSRWLLDTNFRHLLDNTPEVALAGYDLTPQEREMMVNRLSRRKRSARRSGQERKNAGQAIPPTPTCFEN